MRWVEIRGRSYKQKETAGKFLPIIMSFILPAVIMWLAYGVNGIYPLSDRTVLISDMGGQYIDFYTRLYCLLKSGGSLLYSWQCGMGLNFTGLFAYYLSSPFSFIILLFKKQNLVDALYYMTLLKLGSAGVTFSIYLRYLYRKMPGLFYVIFSTSYALMSFCIVYSFNIMWLDGVILLPLVLLGVEKIIRYDSFVLFTISLAVAFISNFYISYMVGLFSFLYLTAGCYSRNISALKVYARKIGIFFLSALLAAGISAFLTVPLYFALKNGVGMEKPSILSLGVNIAAFAAFAKLPIGSYDTLTVGLPNIYCGLLNIAAAALFFVNHRINIKEKMSHLALLSFFILSFVFSILDLMWHCFDHPNWFPFRYSFLFSFLIISMAARCLNDFDGVNRKNILIVCIIWVIIFIMVRILYPGRLTYNLFIINAAFIAAYAVLLLIYTVPGGKRKFIPAVLLILVSFECFLNARYLISDLNREFGYISGEKYNNALAPLNDLIEKIERMDKGFYRIERTREIGRSFNDSLNLNYMGIAHFNSMLNGRLNKFLGSLGFMIPVAQASDYTGATQVTDSLLGIKYILSTRPRGFGYREVLSRGNIKVYENIYALPIGFMADKELLSLNSMNLNPFQLQNDILNLSAGNKNGYVNYFSPLNADSLNLSNASSRSVGGMRQFMKDDKNKEASVELTLTNTGDQQVYGYFPGFSYSSVDVYVNGNFLENYMNYYNNAILDLGYHRKGERIRVKLALKEDSFTVKNMYFYGLDGEAFDGTMRNLQAKGIQVTTAKDTLIEGTIDGGGGLLFTSIPYDEGWSAYVDGSKSQIKKIGGALIGVEIPEGKHEVIFKFLPSGLKAGAAISLLSIAIMALLCWKV